MKWSFFYLKTVGKKTFFAHELSNSYTHTITLKISIYGVSELRNRFLPSENTNSFKIVSYDLYSRLRENFEFTFFEIIRVNNFAMLVESLHKLNNV